MIELLGLTVFLQKFWHVIKGDIIELYNEFYESGSSIRCLNSTFVVLIPKVRGATSIKDFKPISLDVSVYKLIGKVLTRRMAKVIRRVMDEC